MSSNRCPAYCHCQHGMRRCSFLSTSGGTLARTVLLGAGGNLWAADGGGGIEPMAHCGPGRNCTPVIRVAFVRRKGEYGMRWPGQVYDGEAARKKYTKALQETVKDLGVTLEVRESPIYSHQEADEWMASAKKDKKRIKKLRKQLSSISWFMAILLENIARRANREDACRGHFWETRFRCRECADPSTLLLCGIHVDLNPIKAGEADGPETAPYTSVFQRVQAQGQRKNARDRADGWMAELTVQPENTATQPLADTRHFL